MGANNNIDMCSNILEYFGLRIVSKYVLIVQTPSYNSLPLYSYNYLDRFLLLNTIVF